MGFDGTWPTHDGMYLRDAIDGSIHVGDITDVDDNTREVQVKFPHDTVDTFKTTFDKDAFKESFQRRLPLMCWQHDLRDPIGHATRADVLPSYNEIIGQFDDFDCVPNAKRAFSQIQSKTITDFSFGFRQPKYEPHRSKQGVRNIRSAIMMEFSPVSIGSIPGAVATALREEDIQMAEQVLTATDIIAAVNAGLMGREDGQRALAQLDGFRDHITVVTPEAERIAQLEATVRAMKKGEKPPWLNDDDDDDDDDDKKRGDGIAESRRAASTGMGAAYVDHMESRVGTLEAEIETLRGVRAEEVPVPTVINAEAVLSVLPENWQRALDGAAIAVAPAGTKFFSDADQTEFEESVRTIAGAIQAAHAKAAEWVSPGLREDLPTEIQSALELFDAAGVSANALMDVVGDGERANSDSTGRDDPVLGKPGMEPPNPPGTEDMGPTAVKCGECGGTGEAGDGKICPRCAGSGIEALTRAEGEGVPQHASKCPTCQGEGGRPEMGSCDSCGGKGWLSKDEAAEMNLRNDIRAYSDTPWAQFSPADYTPEQWKSATLVHGAGEDKASHKLPIKEPSGAINVHGVHAAASRISQLKDVSHEDKVSAANAIAGIYGRLKEDLPEHVAALSTRQVGREADEDEDSTDSPYKSGQDEHDADAQKQELEAKLNKVAREPMGAKNSTTGKDNTGKHVPVAP